MSQEKDNFCAIPIDLVIKFGKKIPFDVYIKLSENNGKTLKLSHKDEGFEEIFKKYKAKGVKEVYAKKEEFTQFIQEMKENLTGQFFTTASTDEKLQFLDKTLSILKTSFKNIGVSEVLIKTAQDVANKSVKTLKDYPGLLQFYLKFKENCSQEFMHNLLVGYTSTCMLENVDWSTESIKEKSNLACFLRDILLEAKDFEELNLKEKSPEELSPHILEHPQKTAELLKGDKFKFVSQEVLIIIEQHHERPEGKGFPAKINHSRITPLSAIHIVADEFVKLMIQSKFDGGKRPEIMAQLIDRFHQGNYKKSYLALQKMFK